MGVLYFIAHELDYIKIKKVWTLLFELCHEKSGAVAEEILTTLNDEIKLLNQTENDLNEEVDSDENALVDDFEENDNDPIYVQSKFYQDFEELGQTFFIIQNLLLRY